MHVGKFFARNLGGLIRARTCAGPAREGKSRTPSMYAGEKSDEVVFTDDALPVADQVVEQVEYLWRDGDDVRPAMQLAPVSVECVLLEEIAQVAIPSGGHL